MRNKLSALIIAATLTLTPHVAQAQHTVQVRMAANIRSGPGTSYSIVGGAKKGDVFTVRGQNDDGQWYRIGTGRWIYRWTTNDYIEELPPGARE